MRVWLAGSRAFGKAVFKELLRTADVDIVGITAPQDDALWDAAWEHAIDKTNRVPFALSADQLLVQGRDVDLIVCAQHYGFVSEQARDHTTYGAIGYHPSLLPRHRGPSAVEWTIAMGDPIAGGTVYLMDDGYDTGPILAQDWCHVQPGWTAKQLWSHNLFPMGVRLLREAVPALDTARGWLPAREQDERFATTEPKWTGDKTKQVKFDIERLLLTTRDLYGGDWPEEEQYVVDAVNALARAYIIHAH